MSLPNEKSSWKYKSRATNRYPKGKRYLIQRFSLSENPTPQDLQTHDRVVNIFKKCFREPPWGMDQKDAERQALNQLEATFKNPHGVCLVVRHKGTIVGFALGLPLASFPIANKKSLTPVQKQQSNEVFVLSHVGIHHAHRLISLARKLTKIRQVIAMENGYSRALVALHPDANPRFVKSYVDEGFQRIESRTFKKKPDEPVSPDLYDKALNRGRPTVWTSPKDNWYFKPPPHGW